MKQTKKINEKEYSGACNRKGSDAGNGIRTRVTSLGS
jgi:hypothetical protein